MDVVATIFSTITGLAGLVIATLVWTSDRKKDEERQARLVSAWAVREGGSNASGTAKRLRGVVVQNSSDAPLTKVGVRINEHGAASPDPGQMYAQVPPGTYYLQRNDDTEKPWSAPFAVDSTAGGLTVTLEGEEIPLVPVSEYPPKLQLKFLGYTDTSTKTWWRLGAGELINKAPGEWNDHLLESTTKRNLELPQRGRDQQTDFLARLLREVVNLVAAPGRGVDLDAAPKNMEVDLADSSHPLSAHVRAIGLTGQTGMSLRLMTRAGSRDSSVYYLEARRHGQLPAQFFFGDVSPTKKQAELKKELIAAKRGRAPEWTAETLADALTEVVTRHQASSTTPSS